MRIVTGSLQPLVRKTQTAHQRIVEISLCLYQKTRDFLNKVLNTSFVFYKEEGTGVCRKFKSKELDELFILPNIVMVMELRRIR